MTTPANNTGSIPIQGAPASLPVTVMNSDQIGGSGGAGSATAANQTTQITAEQAIQASVASIDTKTPVAPATAGNQTAEATLIGAVTEAAPATDTASSGLNGRLQRIAQRLTSLIALLPAALGAGGGLKVDGSGTALPVSGTVAVSTAAVTVADGADVTQGALADAVVAAGATGSISAKLRAISRDLVANIVLAAGSAIIGKVGIDQTTPGTTNRADVGGSITPVTTPTLSVAGSYVTGDYIGPSTTPASITNAVRASGASAVLESIVIADKTTTAAVNLELWLFNATVTVPTDNAAWSITDADALKCVGVVPLSSANWYASDSNKQFTLAGIGLEISCAVTTLFYALVARGTTPTWVNGDLQLTLGFLQQ